MWRSRLIVIAVWFFTYAIASFAQPDAKRITATNAATLVMDGPKAWGGIDDYWLTNGTLCAVVSDPSHEMDITTTGGYLVDLGFCGRADDQFIGYQFQSL